MRITTPSSEEIAAREHEEPACPFRCPVCSGSLIPLHHAFRCSRCSYYICAGCEPIEQGPVDHPFV